MSLKTKAINPWLLAIRPKTLTAGIAPIAVGTSLSIFDGFFNIKILVMICIATVAIQISTNLINDYYDFLKGVDTKEHQGFSKVLVEKLVSIQAMRKAIISMLSIAALASSYLILKGGWPIAAIAISAIFFAITYTAGPFPLSYTGLADPVELIYFGPVAVGGTYFLMTKSISVTAIIAGFIPGFLSLAILTLDNLRDYENDKAKGKKTLCVRFGPTFGQIQYYSCLFLGFLTPIILVAMTKKHLLSLSCLACLPLYKPCMDAVKANLSKEQLNEALRQTALSLILVCLVFATGWMF